MNVVPEEFNRIKPEVMRPFIVELFKAVEMSSDRAALMADLLVATDLRGVFSHGTRQAPTYLGLVKRREVNPNPEVRIEGETPATAVLDGDGGMGHFASWQAAHRVVEKAKAVGLGAVVTRNHHHFGGAGKYSRVMLEAGLVGFVVSSHVRRLSSEHGIMAAGGASPMSFAVPAGSGPPLVLDMATSFHPGRRGNFPEIFEVMPAAFFKSLGLGAVCHALGGLLAGIQTVEEDGHEWPAVNQGSFMIAVDLAPFASPERFRRQMDDFVASVQALQPFPGQERSMLPGQLEWEREREWSEIGIPVSPEHQNRLEEVAKELGVQSPF